MDGWQGSKTVIPYFSSFFGDFTPLFLGRASIMKASSGSVLSYRLVLGVAMAFGLISDDFVRCGVLLLVWATLVFFSVLGPRGLLY